MATYKYYDIYFDKWDLEVDKDGRLLNPEVLKIIQFECDEESDEIVAVRRVAYDGSVIEVSPDLSDLCHYQYDNGETIDEAFGWFEKWLEENTEWRESSSQTYWQPAEYICIGITGCVDDEPRYHRHSHSWY